MLFMSVAAAGRMTSSRSLVAIGTILTVWTISLLYLQFWQRSSTSDDSLLSFTGPSHDHYESVKPETIRKNLWKDLTAVEAEGLRVWLHAPERGLNLTPTANATKIDDISIQVFELLRPNKTDALTFVDHSGPEPARYARVTFVNATDAQGSYIDEYKVGPFPIGAATTMEPLTYVYNSGRSRTKSRDAMFERFQRWSHRFTHETIYDIAHDLFNFTKDTDDDRPFLLGGNDPFWREEGRSVTWFAFMRNTPARSLLSQPLYCKLDLTSTNISEWQVLQYLYNGILYDDLESFKTAWKSPEFVKLPPNLDGDWSIIQPDSNPTANFPPAPKVVQPGPPRFYVDEDEYFVSWLNFTFNIGFNQFTALSLFDIRVDGERIFWELTFQEAMAHYAGNDPKLSGTAFLDSSFSFGALLSELAPGYDCPDYARYLDTEFHRREKTYKRKNTICVFETPLDFPYVRHEDPRYTRSFTSTALVVRSIATVGNYDYLTDYIFYVDGSVEVKIRASGYIQGAYALHNQLYGYKVRDTVSTAMHDHVINFKADLDIGGFTSNSFHKVDITAKDISYPWSGGRTRRTMVLDPHNITSESEASIDWPSNSAAMYLISAPETNQWGELRSYRISPGTGIGTPPHLTMRNSSNLVEAARWAENSLYVTRQHDTEPRSCSPYNGFDPDDPLVRFADFLADNETLVNEDLVLWFNLGSHHVPNSGDIPNTVMTGSSSSVMFIPMNFGTKDRGIEWSKGVKIEHAPGDGIQWMTTGPAEAEGHWEEVPSPRDSAQAAANDREDLRIRGATAASQDPGSVETSGQSSAKIEFFGPKRSEEEYEQEMERLSSFQGLRTGEMKQYMPMGRDIEIF